METTRGDAMAAIAEEGGPSAVKLITDLMDHSARERESIEASITRSLEIERDEWRARAIAAESRLDRIERKLDAFLWGP